MKLTVWLSSLFILYPYIGYPLILWIKMIFSEQNNLKWSGIYYPLVSVVIAAKNEQVNIERRIRNILQQNYPKDNFEIIVVSDGSTDETNDIVKNMSLEIKSQYNIPAIKLISYFPSQGKSIALNKGVKNAIGEIIVFTDARQSFHIDAIKDLVLCFKDQEVGCVSGELLFEEDVAGEGKPEMGIYWRYEKWIRKQESYSGSMVGATGAIYAIRKGLFEPMPANTILDDVLIPMTIVCKGFSAIFNEDAKAYDQQTSNIAEEWRRKVRTLAGNWQLLSINKSLFIPWQNPLWFRFISHKFLRLIVPFFLPIVLLSCALIQEPFYRVLTIIQLSIYSLVLLGYVVPIVRKIRFINLCFFLVTLNIAAVAGFYYWVTGSTAKLWR
ncbi:MAG: glycosyltransferase family 2 protein [Nitrosomonas ureae]